MQKTYLLITAILISAIINVKSQENKPPVIESWISTPDRGMLFAKEADNVAFTERTNRGTSIIIDERQEFQEIDGFGFAITGGSAELLMKMSAKARTELLNEVFGTRGNGIGVSYLRLTIGSSDLNSFTFSYNDLPPGETDPQLKKFNLSQDLKDVVPVMQEILAFNPDIKILASPWSAPVWMKTNGNIRGGQLKKEWYPAYALYFVKYIEAMKARGIKIDAVTVQNEPLNSKNTPSMFWFENEHGEFIRDHLGPALANAGLKTKIILFDHNLDRPDYPLSMLNDPGIAKYVDGTGFHHYAGDFEAMSVVHTARPDKNLYFTEQMVVERPGSEDIAIAAQVKRLLINTTRNWSRNVILWNLAADPLNDPHTDNGGCSMCQGALTLNGNEATRNLAWYTIAHASKFVRPGSVRIQSTNRGDATVSMFEDEQRPGVFRAFVVNNTDILPNVAFKTPDGKIVLIVVNDTFATSSFRIQFRGMSASLRLGPGAVGTYVW